MEATPILFGEVDMKPVEPVVESAGGSRSVVEAAGGSISVVEAAGGSRSGVQQKSGNRHDKMKIQESQLIFSSIIDEIQTNSIDSITILCNDDKRVTTSCFLLASISPYMATLLRFADTIDYLIVLPDVDSEAVTKLIKIALGRNHLLSHEDKEALKQFEGLLWDNGFKQHDIVVPHQKLNPPKRAVKHEATESSSSNADYMNQVKEEPLEGPEQYFREADTKELSELKELASKNSVLEKILSGRYISEDQIRVDLEELGNIDPQFEEAFDDNMNNDDDYEVDNEEENDDDDEDFIEKDDLKLEPQEKKRKRGRPMKRKLEPLEDPDFDFGIDDNKQRKIPKKPPIGVPVDPNSLNQDDSWMEAQDFLRREMEDPSCLKDPGAQWYEYHGFNPQIHMLKNQTKETELICPVCWISIPADFHNGKAFFTHLRTHKYKNYICPCKPKNQAKEIDHIQQEHWKWIKCDHCPKAFETLKIKFHIHYNHPDHAEPLRCKICNYTATRPFRYKEHMDKHLKQAPNCGCNMTFKNKKHRTWHMQVVHLKEKIGCTRKDCFFLCMSEKELQEHTFTRHVKKEIENPPVKPVCDICGHVCHSASNLSYHKTMKHDHVLLVCPHCPKKFNKTAMHAHIKKVHSGFNMCPECGAKVKRLKVHMQNMHTPIEQMKYKCEFCQKGFVEKGKLEKHMMNVHLKERPYNCRYGCDIAYNDVSNRNQHEKRRHGQLYTVAMAAAAAQQAELQG